MDGNWCFSLALKELQNLGKKFKGEVYVTEGVIFIHPQLPEI